MDFGKKIKYYLKQKGLQQYEAAEKLGTSQQNVSQWVGKSHPPLEAIEKVCKILGFLRGFKNRIFFLIFKKKERKIMK